jgi:FAD/FMN-containing dehydrogenase
MGADDAELEARAVFAQILPAERLLTGEDRALFAMDVYRARALPKAVVQPTSVEELKRLVLAATRAGLAIVVRGGGVSYTDGYLPVSSESVLIDTSGLNRIVELNIRDMYVTVEPGVTWRDLDAMMAEHGLKVPFIGTFSGLAASVGGTISQNANGHGSNANGISADSVIGLEVFTADGGIVRTGRVGMHCEGSFFRNYGPDLTGIFIGDCGALGIKTAVTLKLLRRKPAFETASFAFPDFESLHSCMAAVAAEKIEEKSFGLDLALSQGQIARQDAGSMLGVACEVWRSSPNLVSGFASLMRMAAAGRRILGAAPFAAHYIVDGHSAIEARAKLATLRAIATAHGKEIANSVPTVVRAMPFQPLHNMLGPNGERWVPLHGLFPHSAVHDFHRAFSDYVARRRPQMEAAHVHCGAMFSCIGAGTFLYEPALYWEDVRTVFHERMMEPSHLSRLPSYPPNPEGAALVEEIRTELIELMHGHGAAHFQVGKLYPYMKDRDPGAENLLRAIKQALDPKHRVNPKALGLA